MLVCALFEILLAAALVYHNLIYQNSQVVTQAPAKVGLEKIFWIYSIIVIALRYGYLHR